MKITFTERFKKRYEKLNDKEKVQFKNKLNLFIQNPLHPSLRVKKIQGTNTLFEFSVNMDVRVIWFYEGKEIIALIDIGHHNILNHY